MITPPENVDPGMQVKPPDDPSCPPIYDAQRSLWQRDLAIEGPYADTPAAPYRKNAGKWTHSMTQASKPTVFYGQTKCPDTSTRFSVERLCRPCAPVTNQKNEATIPANHIWYMLSTAILWS